MSRLVWDPVGERRYETGVDRGVVYPQDNKGAYPKGEAWNGLISVTKSPSGAEATALWANNRKYANLISAEELGFSIEAYMYPDSFAACNGEAEAVAGVYVNQQKRTPFGFTYRTMIGNDTEGTKAGYKISLIYGAYAGPSEDADTTINDSPEAKTMSWECTTTPVDMAGFEPTSLIEIDSTKLDETQLTNLAALETVLYGSEDTEARLPMPDEVVSIMKGDAAG
jgi:hypothetical protein